MSEGTHTFEEAIARLEAIAEQIERGQIGLEESISRYEEGMKLVRQCRDLLTRAEMRIQQINQHVDGTIGTTDLPPPASLTPGS